MGPLQGIRVLELAGLGPAPFCAMLLADLGAEVLRIDRPNAPGLFASSPAKDLLNRGKRSVALDLKHPQAVAAVLRLCAKADALVEGFRPGVLERLGLGPGICLAKNPRLVLGRMTGFGQEGPLALAAGHDIDYLALSGALHPIGDADAPPPPPLNLVADFGGGGMLLALGLVSALFEAQRSGRGQVIDAAMVDGAALLTTFLHSMRAIGAWSDERGTNVLDGSAWFYSTYQTKDGKFVALGPLEPQFQEELCRRLGLSREDLPGANNRAAWPRAKKKLAALFREKTRDEWCALLEGSDACFAPVLSLSEAPNHPHNRARGTFIAPGGVEQPAPAPRFSRTPARTPAPPPLIGEDGVGALRDWGFSTDELDALRAEGALGDQGRRGAR